MVFVVGTDPSVELRSHFPLSPSSAAGELSVPRNGRRRLTAVLPRDISSECDPNTINLRGPWGMGWRATKTN
ncbi:hypothetical protein OUZ56_029706 [Daphnia magna]|uniref:Uncharacterized protein n=1 Tax=Daphnia magna TaxID=35525 RepID=A0ABR0B7K8_9CRUS|nr:hypothetical protein OUZ56_029706 [Daphnia magna]